MRLTLKAIVIPTAAIGLAVSSAAQSSQLVREPTFARTYIEGSKCYVRALVAVVA